jgi:hypothetical protein
VNDSAAALADAGAIGRAASGEASTDARSRRLLGPAFEFLLVGGGTLLLLPLCWAYRHAFGLDAGELLMGMLAFHAASLINDPHFAVTYLLFYRGATGRAFGDVYPPRQRARYWVAGVLVPLALVAWSIGAITAHSAPALGALIQLAFVLVGWHYVKQGFGVLSVLSARRGISWSRGERRVILAHCLAGWAYAWASPFDPGTRSVVNGVFYTTLPHPPGLEPLCLLAFVTSGLAAAGVVLRKWRRERRLPPLGALTGLVITVWLWTVYTRLDPLFSYWIPALHSLQYLYFVGLLRRNAALEQAGPPSFKGSVGRELAVLAISAAGLGWLLLRGAPAGLDATLVAATSPGLALDAVGPTPWLAAFTAVVNIHHYFMDSVIWRREHTETRHLLADVSSRESLIG